MPLLFRRLTFFYPETANRTLEDIDRFFEGKPGIFIHRNKVATQLHRPEEYEEADARIAEKEELGGHEKLEKGGTMHQTVVDKEIDRTDVVAEKY